MQSKYFRESDSDETRTRLYFEEQSMRCASLMSLLGLAKGSLRFEQNITAVRWRAAHQEWRRSPIDAISQMAEIITSLTNQGG